MLRKALFQLAAFLFIGSLLLASCAPTATMTPGSQTETSAETPAVTTVTAEATLEATPEQAASPTPTATPIVETRLPPERWQEWPVTPELTGREQAIYQRGLALGNDPHSFSKVGDCQAIKQVLMGIYDQPGRYRLAEADAYLQETIDYFAGSFDRDGQGVRGGYNAAAVLSPLWADPNACEPGENPIECEDRTHNPSFVIISLEVWWEGRTVERYEDYMRQIIDYYLDQGVVPILSTKADNVEGDHRINLATARLAYEYHIPLWNFWLAVQSMPNHGIDPNRDGFHISYDAWTVRSYTALQALDAVWRGVRDQSAAGDLPVGVTPEVTFAEIKMNPAPSSGAIPAEDQKMIFSIEQRQGEALQSAGVFAFDMDTGQLYKVLESGYNLEDMDATGTRLLVSHGSQLFIKPLNGELQPVTEQLALTDRRASAFWLPDGQRLAVLTEETGQQTLWLVGPDMGNWQSIAAGQITGMIKPTSDATFYWYTVGCEGESDCTQETLWRTQDGVSASFADADEVAFSGDGSAYAWTENSEDTTLTLYTRNADQSAQNYLYLPGNRQVGMAWSPLNNRLALLTVTRDDYTGKSTDARVFVVANGAMTHTEYYAFPGLNPAVRWQADGDALLLNATLATETGYALAFREMNLASGLFEAFEDVLQIESEGFITADRLFWITP